MVTLKSPTVPGVPVMSPPGPSFTPSGSDPEDTENVYGGSPPVAATEAEYATPTTPLANEVVVITGGFASTVIVRDFVSLPCGFGAASTTWTVNVDAPAAVGVPLILPSEPNTNPAGK